MTQSNSNRSRAAFESRRNLLKMGSCGAMTSTTFLSTLMHLKMTNAVMAAPQIPSTGYKALVCLFFSGAIDQYNLLMPHGDTQADPKYIQYVTTRSGAALKRNDPTRGIDDGVLNSTTNPTDGYMLPIEDSAAAGGTGRVYGMHHRLPWLRSIYNAGHATFVANTGALVQPIANNAEYALTSKIKPIGLFSHNDQQRAWQTAVPTSRTQVKGWAGKMADLFTDSASSAAAANVFTAISLSGQSLLLNGNRIFPYTISTGGAVQLTGYGTTSNPYDRVFTTMQNDLKTRVFVDLLEKTARDEFGEARDAAAAFQTEFNKVTLPAPPVGSPAFSAGTLGTNLGAVAKAIKIAQSTTAPLKQDRQVFMVNIGGWDHHASLLTNQNTMLPSIDNGLKAFYDFLIAESLLDKVTLFTISDFSRTLQFNGSGSDHAWGGNPFVMGGAVNRGTGPVGTNRIWGNYPDIVLDTSSTGIDRGRGILIPSTSTDSYHAELCRWYGVGNDSNLDLVLPNLRNFNYPSGTSAHPVGFMNF